MATNNQGDSNAGSPLHDVASGIGAGAASVVLIYVQSYITQNFDNDPYYHFIVRIILYIVTTLFLILAVVYFITAIVEKMDDAHTNHIEARHERAHLRLQMQKLPPMRQLPGSVPPQPSVPIYNADQRHVPYQQRAAQRRTIRKAAQATFFGSLLVGAFGIGSTLVKHNIAPVRASTVVVTPVVTTLTFPVVADRDWQDSGITVATRNTVSIQYLQGMWNAWPGNYPDSDANGPVGTDVKTTCTCNQPVAGYSTQALVGRIGDATAFFVGDDKTLRADGSGKLQLRINDDVLADNTGTIEVRITVDP